MGSETLHIPILHNMKHQAHQHLLTDLEAEMNIELVTGKAIMQHLLKQQ